MKDKSKGVVRLQRPRRLRTGEAIRRLVAEHRLDASDLIWPLFIHDVKGTRRIESMPGVKRLDRDALLRCCEQAVAHRIPAVALFPAVKSSLRTPGGEAAWNPKGLVQKSVKLIKQRFPELLVLVDVALDPYTSHGQDGLVNAAGEIENDATVEVLARQGLSLAEAGADIVAPSDMMDGRIGQIRSALETAGHVDVKIMSYAAKYASGFYGPFREAVGSGGLLKGDKRTYQMDPANLAEAAKEVRLDIDEGADMVMVKPGMPYLDVVREIARESLAPVFAYQVSGEYAMIEAAAANGWLDGRQAMMESLLGFKRAGCAGVLTYYALAAAREIEAAR